MFGRVKIYTVHVGAQDKGLQHKPVFVKEGFSIMAFLFPLLWTVYRRLWGPMLIVLAFDMFLYAMLKGHSFGRPSLGAVDLGFRLLIGFQANDWLRASLQRKGYLLTDVSAADSLLRAQQRYLERFVATSAAAK